MPNEYTLTRFIKYLFRQLAAYLLSTLLATVVFGLLASITFTAKAAPNPEPPSLGLSPAHLKATSVATIYLPVVLNGTGTNSPEPITGLTATNNGPVMLGAVTKLTAAIASGNNVTYQWDFGDSSSPGTGPVINHQYTHTGQFTATVRASNSLGFETATTTVIIQEAPAVAGFTTSSPDTLGEVTQFTNTSSGSNLSFTWDFGDGTPVSSLPQPAHAYATTGTFTVTLTAANSNNFDTASGQVVIETPSPHPNPSPPTSPLRAYWTFGDWQDSSDYGNHLTNHNGVSSTPSHLGAAATLQAAQSHYLSISSALQQGLDITGSLTLAGWINLTTLPTTNKQVLINKSAVTGNNRAFGFELRSGTTLGFWVSPDGLFDNAYEVEATLPTALKVDTWYHLAAVFDAQQQTLAIYLNGRPVASRSVTFDHIYPASAPLMLGADVQNGQVNDRYNGKLDDWQVYSLALSPSEIEALIPAAFLPPSTSSFNFIVKHPSAVTQTTSTGRSLHGAFTFGGKIYWGYGDKTNDTGPIDIIPFDPSSLTFLPVEHVAETEAIFNYRVLSNGKLYAPHIDPRGVGTGLAYSRREANGSWVWRSVDLYHAFDMVEMNGTVYIVGAMGNYAQVYESKDGEASFQVSLSQPESVIEGANHARYHFALVFDNKLYVQAGTGDGKKRSPTSMVYDGQSWQAGPDLLPAGGHGSYANNFAGKGVYKGMGESDIGPFYVFDGLQARAARPAVTAYVINGSELYALEADGTIIKTTDLVNWLLVSHSGISSPRAMTFAEGRIFVGNKNSNIYRSNFTVPVVPNN